MCLDIESAERSGEKRKTYKAAKRLVKVRVRLNAPCSQHHVHDESEGDMGTTPMLTIIASSIQPPDKDG